MLSRSTNRFILRALNPFDAWIRRINGKQAQPPLHLRWDVGPLRGFESSGTEFRILLQQFGGFIPSSRILDIGCGCGQLALEVKDLMGPGATFEGWDINAESIRWCKQSFEEVDPRFRFRVLDVRNRMYRPNSGVDAAEVELPQSDLATIIVVSSVFTHMLRGPVRNYLRQIPRLLAPGGRCVASCFLLNERQRRFESEGANAIHFLPLEDGVAVANLSVPEVTVAFDESVVRTMITEAGLRLAIPPMTGRWAGDASGISHQDILILEREH